MIDKMMSCREVIVKLPRQAGKSVCVSAILLWNILFQKNFSILVAAHKGDKARDIINIIKEMFEGLPEWLQQGVREWNKGNVILEHGSRIRASTTSASSARGDTYNMVYLDEFGFVATHIAQEFVKSVIPTVSAGKTTKIFITSTPKGLNLFHTMWVAAIKGKSGYAHVEIKWNDVPGRDEAFRAKVIANFGQEYFDQEYGAEFIGSSKTLIAGSKLLVMLGNVDAPIKSENNLRMYALPVPGRQYAITVDVAEGLGGDATCAVVHDITETPYTQACIYQDKLISPMALPGVLWNLGKSYNEAMILVESNFGGTVASILMQDLNYEAVVMTKRSASEGQTMSAGFVKSRPGIDMNKLTKRQGCSNLKTLVESDQLLIRDEFTYDELCRFAVKGQSYAAEEGHDDLAMCEVMFGWLVDQGYVRDATDVNIRDQLAKLNSITIENELTPFGLLPHLDDAPEPGAIPPSENWLLGGADPEPDPRIIEELHRAMGHFGLR